MGYNLGDFYVKLNLMLMGGALMNNCTPGESLESSVRQNHRCEDGSSERHALHRIQELDNNSTSIWAVP
jgi:hypothetical protein